jgi:nitrite reductase/ring-hydroxylating ferredoxin subunit
VDYVGRAHTSHGADPQIYVAERYVIGQVGFMQHAISDAISNELRHTDEALEIRAVEAWDKLMMVILEMLSRAYGNEREAETFDALQPIDLKAVDELAEEAFEHENGSEESRVYKDVVVARATDIPEGERKLVHVDALTIGIFHHKGEWHAYRNLCLHRGGPVCTGTLDGDTITCPWHGFQYDVTDGHLLVDPRAKLDTYRVELINDEIHVFVPDHAPKAEEPRNLKENEFLVHEVTPGQIKLLRVGEENVAVFNVGGKYFATQEACTHMGGPLSEGKLAGNHITCPLHGSCFDVSTGQVVNGPATKSLKTFSVEVDGEVARVKSSS